MSAQILTWRQRPLQPALSGPTAARIQGYDQHRILADTVSYNPVCMPVAKFIKTFLHSELVCSKEMWILGRSALTALCSKGKPQKYNFIFIIFLLFST